MLMFRGNANDLNLNQIYLYFKSRLEYAQLSIECSFASCTKRLWVPHVAHGPWVGHPWAMGWTPLG